MATPSSSTTSVSPPMAYLQPAAATSSMGTDPFEREQRKLAVQKFLARAELSMVTRALRARLSYASYKATHNISHIPLRDLEARSQHQVLVLSRPPAPKRSRAGANNNYYNNPATQGTSGADATAVGSATYRGSAGVNATAISGAGSASTTSSRTHYPGANGGRTANAVQSLYTSILAPPPTKYARTIHNVGDPPQSSRTTAGGAGTRTHRGSKSAEFRSVRSIAEGTRGRSKNRKGDKRKEKRSPKGSSGHVRHESTSSLPERSRLGEDVDMKAAATLTSLRLKSRPSVTENASSPRSSISVAVMDPGTSAGDTYSHFAQSSTRTTTTNSSTAVNSAELSFVLQSNLISRTTTPSPPGMVTPKKSVGHPTDSEAADLMLYLATSPSPARANTSRDKEGKDLGGIRGGELRATPRVLFTEDSGSALTVQQLLPPAPSRCVKAPVEVEERARTPSNLVFDFNEFINASPVV